jgi:hypothetical protein
MAQMSDIPDQAVMALADHIAAHLREIQWQDSPSELWGFVEELPKCRAANDSDLCSFIFTVILNTFTIEAVDDCPVIPGSASVLKFIDSICDDESFLEPCYERQFPAVILHHITRTPDDDFVQQCLQLLTKFVEYSPVQSPIYPGFVSEIAEIHPELLESIIPLALLTCGQCSSPEDWTKFAVEAVGMDQSAEPLPFAVRVFYTVCIWISFKRLQLLVVSPEHALPILSDLLHADITNTDALECVLELFLAYLPTDRTRSEFAYFLDESLNCLPRFEEFADKGSASAQKLIQLVNELLSKD